MIRLIVPFPQLTNYQPVNSAFFAYFAVSVVFKGNTIEGQVEFGIERCSGMGLFAGLCHSWRSLISLNTDNELGDHTPKIDKRMH